VHLLVADALDDFAAACARLVVDPDLAERLAANAHALAVERYDWSIIERQVADLRRRVSGVTRSPAR
jgi:glycosyltransferase involved in cell wall biosynthesis